ncbi:MAG: cytochrome c [Pyrinomonadaceae bacterium]|nr:cytochrome c [Pyrinomonadaceae bacterium]
MRIIDDRMFHLKPIIILVFLLGFIFACQSSKAGRFIVAESKEYDASLFRQNCAICHGTEGNGKTLQDGTVVPSLRSGEFKFKTEDEIYKQISEGGNGMTPFRNQLSDREIRILATLVHDKLRHPQ